MSARTASPTLPPAPRGVPHRHTPCRIFTLFAFAASLLSAADPSINLQVSSETAPPGGYAQFKISLTAPALISTGSVSMNFDPAIFGSIANVAAFSATGDQIGFATIQSTQEDAYFSSRTASIGQLPALPVFVVTVPVLATAKPGATSSITVDPTKASWLNGNATYNVSVNPGTFTVGGTLSIQDVLPGAGLLPAGTVLTMNGTGFDATTTVAIDGVSLASPQFVSNQQMNVVLGGATEMNGKHIHVANSAGESVDYFAAPAAVAVSKKPSLAVLLPSLPSIPQTTAQWDYPVNAPFVTYYSCLQNPGASPVTATYYYANAAGANIVFSSQTVVIPPYGLYTENNSTFAQGLGPLYMTASAPLRMAEFRIQFGAISPPATVSLNPVQPITSLDLFGLTPPAYNSPLWVWQLGTPAPKPVSPTIASGFPFTVQLSSEAAGWLHVTPTSGGAGSTTLTLTPNVSNLGAGTYTATIALTENLPPDLLPFGNRSTFTVTLSASAQPTLVSANGSTQFVINPGNPTPAPSVITLTTNGTPAPFTASIVPVTGANWLSVTPSSGTTPGPLTLTANPAGLTSGIYNSNLIIRGPLNTLTIPIDLVIAPTAVTVSPTSLTFVLAPGQSSPFPPQILQVQLANPTVTFSVNTQSGDNWLTAASGPFGSVQVSASAAHLGPGTYQGTVTIVATAPVSGTVTVPVTLTITAPLGPQQFSISPSSLTLSAPAGTLATGNLSVDVVGGGSPYFTIPSSTGIRLIQVTPPASTTQNTDPRTTQYTAPATIQVTATASAPGTYFDSITISWNGGSAVIPVTYYATATSASPPVMTAIVGSGSATPGSIAPGELITIFGSGLGGAPATNLGGTEVLINAVAAPLIFSSTGQVNAIVPFEASGIASVQVVASGVKAGAWDVPVVPSAPSIFTLSAAGVGQGSIVNQDGTINNETNPASRGTAIQIYATGGGQTMPSSSTGSVAQVAANLVLPVRVTIGGMDAQVLYAGNAPGEVEGVVQINAMVPPSVTPGAALPVIVTIGGVPSQTGVTIAVR